MESAWNQHYSIPKRIMSLVGQWPYQEKRTRIFRISLLTAVIFSFIIPQVAKIIHCNGNRRCILLVIPTFMIMLITLVKLYTCQFNSSKIKSLIDYVREDWEKLKNAKEYKIMKKYAANARLISLAYCLWCYIAIVIFLLISLIPQVLNVVLPHNESWPIIMPYEAYYFVDSEKYFFYICLHLYVGLNIIIHGVIAHDCMFLAYIEHVCSLFAVTGFCLETLSRNDRNDVANDSQDRKTYDQKIAISVHIHQRALRFANLLEDTFCVSFVIQMLITVVSMSITLLQIALEIDEVMITIKYITYILGQVFYLFFYCVKGQKLINYSVQIRNKIYDSSWYEIPVKSQKLLLYVMRRSLEPKLLTAGKIYVFSLKSFTTVVQSSLSYFTVLASFQ